MTLVNRSFIKNKNIFSLCGLRFHSTNEVVDSTFTNVLFPKLEDVKQEAITPLNNSVTTASKYFVSRSEIGNLLVYTNYQVVETKQLQKIRRGDPVQLKLDLQERLHFIDKQDWRVAATTNKIVVKGNYYSEIKKVLSTTF